MCPLLAAVLIGIFFFLLQLLTVLIKQTRQAARAVKQSIFLRCLWLVFKELFTFFVPMGGLLYWSFPFGAVETSRQDIRQRTTGWPTTGWPTTGWQVYQKVTTRRQGYPSLSPPPSFSARWWALLASYPDLTWLNLTFGQGSPSLAGGGGKASCRRPVVYY